MGEVALDVTGGAAAAGGCEADVGGHGYGWRAVGWEIVGFIR